MQITNTTKGVRLVNAKVGGSVTQVSLAPGETKDVDVIETAAFKARVKAGEFETKGSASKADDGQGGPAAVPARSVSPSIPPSFRSASSMQPMRPR